MTLPTPKKLIVVLLVAGSLIAAGVIFYFGLPLVSSATVRKGSISESVEETGYVRSSEFYDIQALANGQVIRLHAANGQNVVAGQPIVILQNLATETQLATLDKNIKAAAAERDNSKAIINIAKSDFEEAQKDLSRKASLYKSGVISQVEYELVESNLKKAKDTIASLEASLESSEHRLAAMLSQQRGLSAQLNQMVITSPINGRILSLPVKTGQVVQSGTMLATIGSPGSLEVYAEILSDEIAGVRSGQWVGITFGEKNGHPVTGRVKEIYPQAVEKLSPLGVLQRRVPVIVALDDNGPLKPGYEVKLSIRTASRDNTLLIPRESVSVVKNGAETVRIIRSGRVVVRKITTGMKNQFHIEVLNGLKEGDRILSDGSLPFRDGSWVRASAE